MSSFFLMEPAQELFDDDHEPAEFHETNSDIHRVAESDDEKEDEEVHSAQLKWIQRLHLFRRHHHHPSNENEFPTGYDKATAKMLIDHSTAAYCVNCGVPLLECGCPSEANIVDGFVYYGRAYNPNTDASAFCCYHETKQLIVASFRGTVSLTNWKANLKVKKTDSSVHNGYCDALPEDMDGGGKPIRVHSGFHKTYKSIAPEIVKAMVELTEKFPDFQVYVTGHSLGGALATLCCLDLSVRHQIQPIICYTFGQPRVFDAAGKAFFDSLPGLSFYQISNGHDPVPALPSQLLGYDHVGSSIHFKAVRKRDAIEAIKTNTQRSLEKITELTTDKTQWYKFRIIDHFAYAELFGYRRILRGENPPEDPWDPVTSAYRVAVAHTLKRYISFAPDKATLVFVHAHWCPHCQLFKPIFKRLCTKYKNNDSIQFLCIDGSLNDLPPGYEPQSFPTIWLVRPGKDNAPIRYDGGRKLEQVEVAITDIMPLPVTA